MASSELSRQSSVASKSVVIARASGHNLGNSLNVVYSIVLCTTGLVLAVSHFLSGRGTGSGLYLSVFHVYLYGISVLFLIYLQLQLLCRRVADGSSTDDDDDGLPEISVAEDGSAVISLGGTSPQPGQQGGSKEDRPEINGDLERSTEVLPGMPHTKYDHDGLGLNLIFRLGLLVFSMGAVILDGFRLLQFVETESSWYCYGRHFLIHTSFRIAFFFLQTFFIFKNHKLVLRFHTPLMKWGLAHMISTNISIWTATLFLETAESYAHQAPTPQAIVYDGDTAVPAVFNVTRICHDERTLADQASPFLYPCVIQTCLVAAVGLYRIYKNVSSGDRLEIGGWQPVRHGAMCHKANSGLFLGLFLIVSAAVSACFCLLHHNEASPLSRSITILIYASSHIFILASSLLAVIIGFCRVNKLVLGENRGVLNQGLLCLSLVGHCSLLGFIAIPIISDVMVYKVQDILVINQLLFSCLNLSIVTLSILQSTLQVGLTMYGLRMHSVDRRQIKTKPGRSTLTFLMLANVALWLVSTFEVQEIHSEFNFRQYYGELPWQFIVHSCLPITNLFRFQSAVCLSSVWFNAYKMDHKIHGKDSREIHESQNLL